MKKEIYKYVGRWSSFIASGAHVYFKFPSVCSSLYRRLWASRGQRGRKFDLNTFRILYCYNIQLLYFLNSKELRKCNIYVYALMYMYVYVKGYECVCMCASAHIWIYVCLYMYIYVYVFIHVYVCVWMYLCIYVNIYVVHIVNTKDKSMAITHVSL